MARNDRRCGAWPRRVWRLHAVPHSRPGDNPLYHPVGGPPLPGSGGGPAPVPRRRRRPAAFPACQAGSARAGAAPGAEDPGQPPGPVRCVPSAAGSMPRASTWPSSPRRRDQVIGIAEGNRAARGRGAGGVVAAGLGGAGRAEAAGTSSRRHGMRMVGPATSGWPAPVPASTRRSRPGTPRRAAWAWRCSRPAAPASRWPTASRGWHRDLLPGLARRHGRRIWRRHAAVVGSDPATKLALLYLESIGNPRKFARTARRAGAACRS